MKKIILCISISLMIVIISVLLFFSSFPRKFDSVVDKYSCEYNVPKYLVMSVINIESSFRENEISSAGAVGLMQILPSTAFDMANRLNMDITQDDLFDKDINIQIGTYYLRYLLDMFDGNISNTLCAYNWGLNNVKLWLLNGNINESGDITNIPVEETKNYLKKYKYNEFVYKKLYKL